jgi:hypothetical protein
MRARSARLWASVFASALGMMVFVGNIQAIEVDFEDLGLQNGQYLTAAPFTSREASFNNYYDTTYGPYWEGWSCSKVTDTSTSGVDNQYCSVTGGGFGGADSAYGIGYQGFMAVTPTVTFSKPSLVLSAYFTNTLWAYDSMSNGDTIAKKFGGPTGEDPDWYKLTITGKLDGETTGSTEFYLADFRSSNSAEDYIIGGWTLKDLSSLGKVTSLEFVLTSSDMNGGWINTPTYFAMDSLVVPEPGTFALLLSGAGTLAFIAIRRVRKSRFVGEVS